MRDMERKVFPSRSNKHHGSWTSIYSCQFLMLWTYSKVILEHFLNFRCSLNCTACFTWHSIITQVGNCYKHVENLFFQSICTYYLYVSICFEFDKVFFLVWQVLLMWRRKKEEKRQEKRKRKEKWWAVLVMFTWIDWNLTWKFNQSSVLMQKWQL